MRFWLLLSFGLLLFLSAQAQRHDLLWIQGYDRAGTPVLDNAGLVLMDFSDARWPKLSRPPKSDMTYHLSNAAVCDSSGRLQCFSNGIKIFGPQYKLMENGDSITPRYSKAGEAHTQGVLMLPQPGRGKEFFVLNMGWMPAPGSVGGGPLYSCRVDMAQNGGQGKVLDKRKVVLNDTIDLGRLSAVKHANGRDWWVPIAEHASNRFHLYLLGPSGFREATSYVAGAPIKSGDGQNMFTPDGSKFIMAAHNVLTDPAYIHVYDFDRCTGRLSNQRTIVRNYNGFKFSVGVACSPDSRYLYVSQSLYIYQYDLTAPNIAATETVVGQYDGVTNTYGFADQFRQAQLGPDGRVYVGTLTASFRLSYVAHPERKGKACGFTPYGLDLKVLNYAAIPNHPNYRLGPLDNSPCDTLGLDNQPLANFRWEHEDSTELLRVTFTDLSAYEPESWQWDFGDGTGSTERYPVHDYPKEGVYNACLIVKNRFSADTFCQKVYLGVSAQDNPDLQSRIEVWPNPFSDRLVLALSTPDLGRPLFRLFDATGRLVREERVEYGLNEVRTEDLAKGLYFWAVEKKGERVKSGKAVKM